MIVGCAVQLPGRIQISGRIREELNEEQLGILRARRLAAEAESARGLKLFGSRRFRENSEGT